MTCSKEDKTVDCLDKLFDIKQRGSDSGCILSMYSKQYFLCGETGKK